MTTNIEIPKGYKLYDGPKDGRFLRRGMWWNGLNWKSAVDGTSATGSYTYIIPDDSLSTPWTLPAPPAGMSWHRDDWTQEMLPDGWRPLLKGEKCTSEDEFKDWKGVFVTCGDILVKGVSFIAGKAQGHCRTRRPLPTAPSEPADPYAELKAAHKEGKTIEYHAIVDDQWYETKDPRWSHSPDRYRIKPEPEPSPSDDGWIPWSGGECPVDGDAIVEWKCRNGSIATVTNGRGEYKAGNRCWKHLGSGPDIIAYRVISQPEKPWQLPDPPEGRQWHRTDGWKKEDLDGGWRPLMAYEKCEEGDEFNAHVKGEFVPVEKYKRDGITFHKRNYHCRTKRPLPSVQQSPTQSPTQPPPGMRILAEDECKDQWVKDGMYNLTGAWQQLEDIHRKGCYADASEGCLIAVPLTEPEPVKEEPVASTTTDSTTTKTIREWLETLPEPYRSEALELAVANNATNRMKENLSGAVISAFLWPLEKINYWSNISKGLDPHTKLPFATTQEDDWLPEKGKPYEVLPPRSTKWERWKEATNDAHFYKEMIRQGMKYRPVKQEPEPPTAQDNKPVYPSDNTITSTNPEQTENNNNMNTPATITSLPELPPVGSKWAVVYEGTTDAGKVISASPQGIFIKGKKLSCLYTVDTWNSRPKTRIYSRRELRQQVKTQKERHKGIIACASGSDSTKPPFSLKRWALRKAWKITKLTSLYGIGVITAPITGPLIKAGLMSAGAVIWSVVSRLVQQ